MQLFFLYIDPGSGSFLVQAIIAGILGVAFFFKNITAIVKAFFSNLFRKKQNKV